MLAYRVAFNTEVLSSCSLLVAYKALGTQG